MTQQNDLYEKAKNIFREIITLEEDVEQLAQDYTYDKETNTGGIDKKEVKSILKAAEVYVRNSIDKEEDKIVKAKEFVELYKELSGEYD